MAFDFACPDWEEKVERGETPMAAIWEQPDFNHEAAARAVSMFNLLRLPDVMGTPTMGEAAAEWNRDIVRALFGAHQEDGETLCPELFLLLPKKQGKTTLGAAISILWLLTNRRPRAEMIYVAPTIAIAELAFNQAVGMIEADDVLSAKFHIRDHKKEIVHIPTKSVLKIKTFDMAVMTGAKPNFVLVDELHILGAVKGAKRVIAQIRGGVEHAPEAMICFITTQSDVEPEGVFKTELEAARAIRDGKSELRSEMLPILYELSEADQKRGLWRDPSTWSRVMPNLGRSCRLPRMKKKFMEARDKGKEDLQIWASQHLNIQIGLAMHDSRWQGADWWQAQANRAITLEYIVGRCDVAVMGIDAGGSDDLFAICVAGRERGSGKWLMWFRVFCHEVVFERRAEIAEKLEGFQSKGELIVWNAKNPQADYDEAARIAGILNEAYLLPAEAAIGLDLAGHYELIDKIEAAGVQREQLTGVKQGGWLSGAIFGLDRTLHDGRVEHDGSEIMAWMISNAKSESVGNNVKITKANSGRGKIDGLIAALCAFQLMQMNPQPREKTATPWDLDENFTLNGARQYA